MTYETSMILTEFFVGVMILAFVVAVVYNLCVPYRKPDAHDQIVILEIVCPDPYESSATITEYIVQDFPNQEHPPFSLFLDTNMFEVGDILSPS